MENYHEINFEQNMKILSQAIKCCEENLTHQDIIDVLKGDDDIKKQLCLIDLNAINSQEEADILVFNLTGKSGPVRETAAYKIGDLISRSEYKKYFQTEDIINTFIKAITDINPSVSRTTIEFLQHVENMQFLYGGIILEINNTLGQIDIEAKNRSYVQNKKNFNLYWNLEAIISIADFISPKEELFEILKNTACSNDYTIREKVAKAASIFARTNPLYSKIIEQLKDDTNIYVRKYINN